LHLIRQRHGGAAEGGGESEMVGQANLVFLLDFMRNKHRHLQGTQKCYTRCYVLLHLATTCHSFFLGSGRPRCVDRLFRIMSTTLNLTQVL
jgi:hypothetical protein